MTIRRQVIFALVGLLTLAAASTAFSIRASRERIGQLDRITAAFDTGEHLTLLDGCLQDLHRQITLLVQGFDGSGGGGLDPSTRSFLQTEGASCAAEATALIEEHGGDEDAQRDAFRSLSDEVRSLIGHWAFVLENLGGDPVQALTRQAVVADPLTEDLLGRRIPELQGAQSADVRRLQEGFRTISAQADTAIFSALFVILASVSLVLLLVLQRVLGGLGELTRGMQEFGRGNLEHRVPDSGRDELSEVSQEINAMASLLSGARSELSERARDLELSLERLRHAQAALVQQEKMAALGNLVAGVAHEVNTPLGVAVTAGSLVQDRLDELRTGAEQGTVTRGSLLEGLDDTGRAMALLVSNLDRAADLIQSFKQVAVDRGQIETRTTSLRSWISEVVQSVSPLARRHGITIEVEAPSDSIVEVAAGELQQVLTNLLVNSFVHAFPDGSGSGTRRVVRVRLDTLGDEVTLEVSDEGIGMSKEVADRVFEPFFTTRRGRGGTGLGLHIVHQIVHERFRGRIDVDTAPGRGTRWTVRLPVSTDALRMVSLPVKA